MKSCLWGGRAWIALAALMVALAAGGEGSRAFAGEPTRAERQAVADDTTKPRWVREEAIQALATDYDPAALVSWLRERLAREQDFHLRLSLVYALASQGESEALSVLVDALGTMGHMGYVFLTETSGVAFGGPGKGWDKPAWDQWLTTVDPAAWRELQRQRHLPRVPGDADEAGLARAVQWWDTLGYPDLAKVPFVRVIKGSWIEEHGLLLEERADAFTVFTTDLARRTYQRVRRRPHLGVDRHRAEPVDPVRTARAALGLEPRQRVEGDEDVEGDVPDELGTGKSPDRIVKGFVLARLLVARGQAEVALEVWKEIAKESPPDHRYGAWSCFDRVRASTAEASRVAWEEDARLPERTWAESLEALRLHRRRFESTGAGAGLEALLERMASEEARYRAAAASTAPDPAARARDLMLALPNVAREFGDAHGILREPEYLRRPPLPPPDALRRLVELGYDAVPALCEALRDERPTKSAGWYDDIVRPWYRLDLAAAYGVRLHLQPVSDRRLPTQTAGARRLGWRRRSPSARVRASCWRVSCDA